MKIFKTINDTYYLGTIHILRMYLKIMEAITTKFRIFASLKQEAGGEEEYIHWKFKYIYKTIHSLSSVPSTATCFHHTFTFVQLNIINF